jgi:hypothetical protein
MPVKKSRLLLVLAAVTALPFSLAFADNKVDNSALNNYLLKCAGCHAMDGTGSKIGGIPPLQLIRTFTSDVNGRAYLMHVPGVVSTGLGSKEIADVVNYISERWGDKSIAYTPFTEEEVTLLRATAIPDIVSYRRDITVKYQQEGKQVAEYPWP